MPARTPQKNGFTLIEVMITVFILGVLATIAIPAFQRYLMNSRATTFANDIRMLANAGAQYSLESGLWIPDTASGAYPNELDGYFSKQKFDLGTSLGGVWDFESFDLGNYASAVGVYRPEEGDDIFTLVDKRIDDGNLSTGYFLKLSDERYYFIIED